MRNKLASITDNVITLVALRGGIACALVIIANMVEVQQMGKISAIYATVTAVAQIIGYALSILAFDLESIKKETKNWISVVALTCFLCWLTMAAFIILVAVLTTNSFRTAFFHDLASPKLYILGAFWLCAVALEMMCLGLAMVSGRMRLMARLGVFQAGFMLSATTVAIALYGYEGIAATVAVSFFSGTALLITMKPWRAIGSIKQIAQSLPTKMKTVLGPSTAAALFLSSLNMLLISDIAESNNSATELAFFAVSMQIIAILSFIPQIIYGTIISNTIGLSFLEKNYFYVKGYFLSLVICSFIFVVLLFSKDYILYIFGDEYTSSSKNIVIVGLILIAQGPLQILTQRFINEQRQLLLAFICFLSTVSGYIFFIYYDVRSSYAMLLAIMASNFIRLALVALSFVPTISKFR